MGITGGAVVSGSFQGFDQDYLTTALADLGPGYVGVTQLPADTPDARILELNTNGVRAVRFNLRRGGSEDIQHLDRMARRVHELAGWHTELYVDSAALEDLYEVLHQLPQICIDHLGLSADGFTTLIKLAEGGAHIKATGFGRVAFDIPDALRAIDTANPNALMFGTDLPSTRAPRPFSTADTELIETTLGSERYAAVMHDNAAALYRP